MAGWAFCVSVSSSSGPSHMSRESAHAERRRRSAAKISRAAGNRSARSLPMPTFCAPWPGQTSSAHHRTTVLAQVKPAPNDHEQQQRAGHDPSLRDGLIERERDRRGRRVAVAIDVDHHRSIGMPACFAVASMMRMLAWCGTSRSIWSAVTPARRKRLVARFGHGEHGGLEDLAARHADEVRALRDHLLADRIGGAATRPVQQVAEAAVGLM